MEVCGYTVDQCCSDTWPIKCLTTYNKLSIKHVNETTLILENQFNIWL